MREILRRCAWAGVAACVANLGVAAAQGPNLPSGGAAAARSSGSLLGPAPGALPDPEGDTPNQGNVLGGRAGPSAPRVPTSALDPAARTRRGPVNDQLAPPSALPLAEVPLFGPLANPDQPEDEGPPGGMTLDMAIDQLARGNLALKARALEIPQAEADILTASLRANPLVYADAQLVPYGNFTDRRPGGQTQYDVNITYPIDVTRKRKARTQVAMQAKRSLEAQYQDSVRLEIDNVYTAFANVLSARETIRFAATARDGLRDLTDRTRRLFESGTRTAADVSRLEAILEAAEVEVVDAEETLRSAKRNLGVLLAMPGPQAEAIEVRGSIRDQAPEPGPVEELIATALSCRPDVVAFRLGINRAGAEVNLARANRLSDVYVLAQPYTFQNNAPTGTKSAYSWALGVTVPLPIYNRNQGNIERARVNVNQSKLELADRELQVTNEVRQAEREYRLTRGATARIEGKLLPAATRVRDDAYRLYLRGEEPAVSYLNAQREFNEASRQYRDMLVRHRRSMFRLNTAVGQRVLP